MHTQVSFVNRLSPLELAAWRGFLRVHAELVRELDAELQAAHGLPLHEYEVLLTVDNASGGRLRMTELASSVLQPERAHAPRRQARAWRARRA